MASRWKATYGRSIGGAPPPHDIARVEAAAEPTFQGAASIATDSEDIVAIREAELTAYQDAAYAQRYRELVDRVTTAERNKAGGMTGSRRSCCSLLLQAVGVHRMSTRVARLYADESFLSALNNQFEGDFTLRFHLAPPIGSRRDPQTDELQKR